MVLCAMMALTLAGCGGSSDDSSTYTYSSELDIKNLDSSDTEVLYQWKDLVPTYEERITRIDGIYMDKVTCESADAIYELKGDAKLPVKNVTIKNVKVGEVKKFVKKVNNVENVVEKNVTYEREVK